MHTQAEIGSTLLRLCNTNYSFLTKHTTAQSNLLNLLLQVRFFFYLHANISTHSTRTKIQTQIIKSEFFPCMMLFSVRILKCEEKEQKENLNCSTSIFQKAHSRSLWSVLLSELKLLHKQNASNNQDKFNKDCDI